jgi:2-methylisocitrate lyase-like PEP mutase family enzyme
MDVAKRTPLYMEAGADGVYVEAVETTEELERTARALRWCSIPRRSFSK